MSIELKCIICDKKAEYIHLVLGTGGTYCKTHLEERKEDVGDIKKNVEEILDRSK